MKLFRYMSVDELIKFFAGKTLHNTTDHGEIRGKASTAKGFCFGIGDVKQARKALRRLRGIANTQILLVFTPKNIDKFTPCRGRYVDYDKMEAEGKTSKDYRIGCCPYKYFDEYCIESYSVDDIEKIDYYGNPLSL